MPKERFFNLPEEKKERILEAAVLELSRVPFHEMSINKVVQSAGIPRGSFYQYFENKFDLLEYVMRDYKALMDELLKKNIEAGDGDMFEFFLDVLEETVIYGTKEENYAFCKNIFSHLRIEQDSSFELTKIGKCELMNKFLPYIHKENLRFQSEEDFADFFDMVLILLRSAIAKIFLEIDKKEEIQKSLENKFKLLKYGMLKDRRVS